MGTVGPIALRVACTSAESTASAMASETSPTTPERAWIEAEMRFGDPADFAIDCEITDRDGAWVYGTVVFRAKDEVIGNADDAADLLGCRRWMRGFLARSREPADDALEVMTPAEFFAVVFDPVMDRGNAAAAVYPDAFRRFSISHLGMSSFDRYDLLLVPLHGGDRLLWRETGKGPRAHDIAPGLFRRAVTACVDWMDSTLPGS